MQPNHGEELRVGLVGAGNIAPFHLAAWSKVPGASVVAIADPDTARASERARAFGVERVHSSLDALLEAERIDLLDIASPRQAHAGQVRAAAARGIPVLCQKPLAPTLAEAEELVADVSGRARLMVHENWRFRPYYRQVGAWQDRGLLGRVTYASLRLLSSGMLPDGTGIPPALAKQPFMRTERRLLVAETLIHHLDTVRWLFGPLRLTSATMQRTSGLVVGETVASLTMLTEDGAPVLVEGNLTCPGFSSVTRDRAVFVGTEGTVTFEQDRLCLHGPAPEAIQYVHDEAYQACFDATVAHFVQAVRAGAPFETDCAENLETLRLVEAAYAQAGWDGKDMA